MKLWFVSILAPMIMIAATSVASAQPRPPGELDGHELAGKLCSNCHAVEPAGVVTGRADVPSFRAIANGPRTTPERLASAIILPHPAMPGVPLTRAEVRAIIDYIMSLRTAP
jgi:mono/diheme cytochrome c family protein